MSKKKRKGGICLYLVLGLAVLSIIFPVLSALESDLSKDVRKADMVREYIQHDRLDLAISERDSIKTDSILDILDKEFPTLDSLAKVQQEEKRILDEMEALQKQKQAQLEKFTKYFSAWDGSHITVEQQIKKEIKDPSSYEHIETGYTYHEDHIIVKTRFRGKNSFGALIINTATAKVVEGGQIVSLKYN